MMVDLTTYVDVVPKEVGITELVYYPALKKILDENESLEDIKEAIRKTYLNWFRSISPRKIFSHPLTTICTWSGALEMMTILTT